MNPRVLSLCTQRTLVAVAACAVCVAAQAQSAVEASVSAGLGIIDTSHADRAVFGQYNGLSYKNTAGLLGIDYSLRDQEAGKWVDFTGSDLLGSTRELNFVWKIPGAWKFTADYSELVRIDPNTLNTSMLGAGTTTPQVIPMGAGIDTELKTKRTGLGLGLTKIISPTMQLQIDFKSENKEGSAANNLAYTCTALPGVICNSLFPEPINANHSQIEARISYSLEKLRFNVGYYGSFYRNSNASIIPSGLPSAFALNLPPSADSLNLTPLALAPDNQAHELDISGNYDFTQSTRGTFKLAWSTALQNADFAKAGLTGPASSAGARIDTTLVKLGFTSRPMQKLSVLGDLRYENKNDQTPLLKYNLNKLINGLIQTNRNLPNTKVQGKLQASWQFNSDYRGTVGADYESIDRGTYTPSSVVAGVSALRQKTEEIGIRAELRRRLTEDLTGALSVSSSNRDGSNWLQPNGGLVGGVTEVTNPSVSFAPSALFMPTLANRQRDKVKLFTDWQANKQLSLQFSAEENRDKFDSANLNGLHATRMSQIGVDWAYTISSSWAVNGYFSQTTQSLNQSFYQGAVMTADNTSTGASIGLSGRVSPQIRVGASLVYVDDHSSYAQSPEASAAPSVAALLLSSGGLPNTSYNQVALKLFGTYALEKKSIVRLDVIHQRTRINDWTWGYNGVPFTYSDGATITQNPNQNVNYIGVTYVYQLP